MDTERYLILKHRENRIRRIINEMRPYHTHVIEYETADVLSIVFKSDNNAKLKRAIGLLHRTTNETTELVNQVFKT